MSVLERPQPSVAGEWVESSTRWMRRARAKQLDEIGAAVRAGRWAHAGYRSPNAWLAHVTGESPGACRVTLLLAERVAHLPLAHEAFEAGRLSETGLRLLAEAWSPGAAEPFAGYEEMLLGWVIRLPHRDAKTVVQTWLAHADPDQVEATERERFDRRRLHISELLDGMGRGDFLLDAEGLAVVRDAISFLGAPADADTRSRPQRHADALVQMARFVLTNADAPLGGRRRVPRLVATAEYAELAAGSGLGTIEAGHTKPTVVSAEAIRRLACDAGIHRFVSGAPDHKVHYGRGARSIPEPLYEFLCLRDHGCRWPGCSVPGALCEGHHAEHWLDHGETEPDNVVLLCWFHHHLLHEQHWSIEPLGAGHFQLHDPDHATTELLRPPMVGPTLPFAIA